MCTKWPSTSIVNNKLINHFYKIRYLILAYTYFGSFSVKHYIEKLSLRILVGFKTAKINSKYTFLTKENVQFQTLC